MLTVLQFSSNVTLFPCTLLVIYLNSVPNSVPVISTKCKESFLRIPAHKNVHETEDWKGQQTTMYTPVKNDIMVNVRNIEQFSFSTGSFFVADENGTYQGSEEGISMQ